MKVGLVGLPTVGKTTFFNLLTKAKVETKAFISGKVEANFSLAKVPDERVDFLAEIYKPKKVTHAQIEVTDIPGLVRGASQGLGTGNQFLNGIRKVDALVQIVRAFEDKDVIHVDGSIDITRDIETINTELLLADLQLVETRLERINTGKKITKEMMTEKIVLEKLQEALENEITAANAMLTVEERETLRHLDFLTEKPVIIVVNVDEKQLTGGYPGQEKVLDYCSKRQLPIFEVCAKIEMELDELDSADRADFLQELGITESGINLLAKTIYTKFGLISFLTTGDDEVRAWTIKNGAKAKAAAGKIHSDIERGFIRAEVINFREFKVCGSMAKAKEMGKLRLEGKEYVVEDGDIINFRFNV
ncbi:MAG: redox-regulated ATPase YchF [Bacillota bacterium]